MAEKIKCQVCLLVCIAMSPEQKEIGVKAGPFQTTTSKTVSYDRMYNC